MLSEDFVLFLRHSTLCLELCHVTTSLRGMRNVNNDNIPPPTLHIVCTLAVLIFHHKYCMHLGWRASEHDERSEECERVSKEDYQGDLAVGENSTAQVST